jgi:hypothetical protein
MRAALFIAAILALTSVPDATSILDAQQPSAPPASQRTTVAGAAGETTPTSGRPGRDQRQTGTAVIRGRVIRSDTGQPLRRVEVRPETMEAGAVFTDDNGRYEIAGLPAGSYQLNASKPGFAQAVYGQRRPFGAGRPVTVADSQILEKIDFALSAGGVITGRLVDEIGEPVIGAGITVLRLAFVKGRRQPSPVGGGQTDDRGEFRVWGLSPGEYLLRANHRLASDLAGARLGYVPTYYPGTPVPADAQRIVIKAGEEIGLTFALSQTRTASISGIVRAADGSASALTFVTLRQRTGDDTMDYGGSVATKPDGSFIISNVPPGSYTLEARALANTRPEWALRDVVVSGRDVSGLVMQLTRGVAARGRIRFDTRNIPKGLKPEMVRVFSMSEDHMDMEFGQRPPEVRDDWTFEVANLSGPRSFQAVILQGEWFTKSVSVDGVDVTDSPIEFGANDVDGIELVLSQQMTEISGVVTDARGAKVTDAAVVAFASEPEKWTRTMRYVRSVRPDQEGRFQIRGLPTARYVVVAVEDLEPGEEADRAIARATETQRHQHHAA